MFNNSSGELRVGFTYAVGDLVSVGLRYAPAVLYPLFLSPAEYGIFAVTMAISFVMGIVVVFGLKGAAFKQSFDYEVAEDRKSLYGSLFLFIVIGGALFTFLVDRVWSSVFASALANIPYDPYIRLSLWTAYLNGFGIILYEIYRAQAKARWYVAFSVANAGTLVILAYILVAALQLGLLGAVLAPAITGLVWAVIYTIATAPHMKLRFDLVKLRNALAYGLPLVPHQIGHWMLNLSDRIILERNVPISDLGVYGFGYNLGNVEQVFANAGNSALMPNYGKAAKDAVKRQPLPGLFANYLTWVGAGALGISIFADEFIAFFMPASFAGAGAIVPWVALGFFCVALYYAPMNALTLLAGETRWVWLFTILAGAVNIGANLLLVPLFGIQAAAVNTLVGYFSLFVMVYFYSRRFVAQTYPWKRIALVCASLVAGVLLDRMFALPSLWLEGLSDLGLFAAFALAFLMRRS
ncbi:MAG: polysaccharide biosynthesis C-terminal domain-containing protein [Anaerolineales bacterium]